MGTGISTVCGSKQSVLISNSVRKLPTIHEDDVDSDCDVENDLEINPTSGKLHQAESRDSGIGENDVPGGNLFHRNNLSNKNRNDLKSVKEKENEKNAQNDETARASRPHSCRLGHRGHKSHRGRGEAKNRTAELSDSQISRFVRSAKHRPIPNDVDQNEEMSDDTLSLNSVSSVSPERQVNARPKSARKRVNKRNKANKSNGRNSAKLISDLDTSTDTETSDTDMLSIPDETGAFNRSKDETTSRNRRGWVKNESFTDVVVTSSVTPRTEGYPDMYRIVSGSYADLDINLAKKASERSISSIILMPLDGMTTPTNSECFDTPDLCNNCEGMLIDLDDLENKSRSIWVIVTSHQIDQVDKLWHVRTEAICLQRLDDLVTSMTLAVKQLKSRGLSTPADYEGVLKSLRYQLVAMAMGYSCRQSTPRIEVKGSQTDLFSDNEWKVEIRLKTEDEEIIETSENLLAQRLAKRKSLSRQEISILLAEHLKTIEKLQQVQQAGKLNDSFTTHADDQPEEQEDVLLSVRRPVSARKLRKLNSGKSGSSVAEEHSVSDLPPVGRSKGNNSRKFTPRHNAKSTNIVDNAVASPESSPDANNRKHFNESGIDSETEDTDVHSVEEEDVILFKELIEAFRVLWDNLTSSAVSGLLEEYRKREAILIQTVVEHAKKFSSSKTPNSDQTTARNPTKNPDEPRTNSATDAQMGQENSSSTAQSELDIRSLDDGFVKRFQENRESSSYSVDDFTEELTGHMKKTRLIRVQSFNLRQEGVDWNGNQRSNSFTGFGNANSVLQQNPDSSPSLKRQHSFTGGGIARQNSFAGSTRQNSFLRSLPGSRQNSYCRTRSRGSTGSSYTYSTTSSGFSTGNHSELSDSSGSGIKSAFSRESSYGVLTEFADIDENDEESKTARENSSNSRSDCLRPPSGRKTNGPRVTSGQFREREKRRGQTQVHGLGLASVETAHTPLRKIEEDALPKVEECESKLMVRSRPDSGIAVSTSSASYSSSELHKERDLDEHYMTCSCLEMKDKVSEVLPDEHNDLKSLVAKVTKGLTSVHSKAQALYCWLTSQNIASFENCTKKSNSPSGRLKAIHEKKSSYCSLYMDMLKIAGVKCERVEGYMKSEDYLPGNTVQTNKFQHSWVAVSMDGHYRLVDPHYGAQGDKFNLEHYFATSPDGLILSHFPKDKKWLLMNQPATIEVFEGTLKTWPAMFHFNIRPLNMKSVIKTYDGKLSITVLLQNVAVNPQLEYAGPGPEIDSDILEEKIDHEIRDVDNAETYHVTLPQEGNYYFTVYAHVLEDGVDVPVFQYRIEYTDELL